MTSLSTRFLGQPRLTMPTLIMGSVPSRVEPVQGARVGDGLAQVMDARDPGDETFDPHPEAAVRHRAVLADVEVPLKRLDRQAVLLDARQQQVVVVDALAAPDDLSVPLGGQDVD